ncbi:MAG: Holliday junction branch migration protein RuvA [Heliobacteriaceae bacterium]|jgi:Holliday junction DNA helicase RuvA|nr:Holliday junction branch migration protein RuvA [Heliobacteriaceae bacterium]
MYDYIKGMFTNKADTSKGAYLTVETGGVGYLAELTGRDFAKLPETGVQGKIYTVLLHREDKMSLCGFLHREDRDIFNILVSVSGVGSKMALTLLAEFEPSELIGFVIGGNFKELTRAKGVGPKLAQKIILELKDKLMNYQTKEPIEISCAKQDSRSVEDAQTVLNSLGYERAEIKDALGKAAVVLKADASAEEILKEALKVLST